MNDVEYIVVNKVEDIARVGYGLICAVKFNAFQVELRYASKEIGFKVELFPRLTDTGHYALTAIVIFGSDTPAWFMVNYKRTVATILNVVRRKSDNFDTYRYTETAVMDGLLETGAAKNVATALKGLHSPPNPICLVALETWK